MAAHADTEYSDGQILGLCPRLSSMRLHLFMIMLGLYVLLAVEPHRIASRRNEVVGTRFRSN